MVSFNKDKSNGKFWSNQFSGNIEKTHFPFDYYENNYTDNNIASVDFTLSKHISNKIMSICAGSDNNIFAFLVTNVIGLLYRYSGKKESIIGIPINKQLGKERLLNTSLFIRNDITDSMSYKELLVQVRNSIRDVNKNQNYHVRGLLSELGFSTDKQESNLAHVKIMYDNIHFKDYLDNINSSMFFIFKNNDDYIECTVEYDKTLYRSLTIERIISHYIKMIKAAVENILIPLNDISLIEIQEKEQILQVFNDTSVVYDRDKTIQDLFEVQAMKYKDRIAVNYDGMTLTYSELNNKANYIARSLVEKGVTHGDIIAINANKSLEMIIGILAVLKAGAAYLPLDFNYPSQRIRFMLDDCGVKLLLSNFDLDMEYEGIEILKFNSVECPQYEESNIITDRSSSDLAYIMYTSGSSGKPKGVMVEHINVVRLVENISYVQLREGDHLLQTGSIAFDAAIFEIWGSLLNGLTLFMVPQEKILSSDILEKIIYDNKINIMWLTVSLFNKIISENENIFNSLDTILVGGDKLTPSYINKLRNVNKNITIINGYGPTENTTFSTCFTIQKEYKHNIPIGKPISNSKAFVLDSTLRLQPIGVVGELFVSGDGVARGYLNNEQLTKERFMPNPYVSGERMYKTGDLARWLPDGNIEFCGRADDQVKIRGYRIELGEIESLLLLDKRIKEAVVLAKGETDLDKYLCAYITTTEEVSDNTIKENLSIVLPDYMIPSAIVRLESIPLTTNGKIDKKTLPTPQVEGSKNGKYEGSSNEIEEKLIELWEDILGVKRISINDSFFELGGHSLRASILVKQIYMCFKKTIPLRTIFLMPTIKQIAQVLSTMHNDDIEIIDIAHKKDYYPLSSAQKRLYTLQQLEEGTTSYNIPNIVEIQGTIEEECLQNAFKKLLDRHETLRTSFEIVNDEPVQMIHDEIDACVEVIEIEEKDIQETIKSLIKPFELNKAPLIRVTLIKVSDGKSLLMYDIHHIISDGISMKILVEEFMKLYSKKELPQLTRQYKDYSEWQNKLIESKEFKKEKAYWLDMFSGNIPVLNMSSDYTRPAVKKYDGRDIEVELNIDVVKKLKKLSGDTGTTMYMILMAAFNVLMSKYSNQEDIVVGTPIAGRSHIDLEGIIGMFVNTLAMRNKPESEKTFLEFLNEVKETALQAYENQNYQFEELVNHLEVVRDFSRNPIFDVMFAMQNFEKVEIEEKGLRVTPYNYENSVAKFDLTMTAIERDERIMVSINYCTSLFKEDTIMRMMEHYENILSIVTEDENVQLKDIDMLSTDEKEMVVKAFNDTYVKYNKHRTIQEIFEKQVEESYERTALIYEDQDMTYEELNRRANQLARKLRGYGVTKDSIVGLMVERSFEMIVGIMGILKAGGAYLPIDPEYPQNRIEYMLGNSETRILLTQSWIREKVKYQHKIIELDNEELYEGDSSNPVNINEGRDLAYVIYTSGSTGKPKGVMIEHCNLNNIVTIMQDKYPVKEDGAYLLKTNFTFDVSIVEIFGWILSKGRLVILKQGDEKDINRIINAVDVHKVTHINFVPSMLNVLVNHLDEVNKRSLKHLEYVMVAGEAFSVKLAKEISIILDTNIENIYGPTEATVYSTGYSIKDVHKLESVPIGKALDNVKIHIVDKNLRLKPIGIVGELCISGAGVARGYLNNEQLTRERFIPNPYVSGEIMYKTGDLARWLPDGNIEFCGRADDQVKIRGYRIELGEIESQLLSDKRIEEAVVVSKGETDVDKYLCAYVTTTEEIGDNTIKEYLRIVLPNYMIPSVIVRLESMPLTVNGKIDKKALPTPNVEGSKNGEYEGPRNQTEEKLTKLWEDVLGVKKISINDNFFELGGHSLRATVLASKIHKKFSVNIPLSQIFNSPNIKELSEYIVKNEKEVYKSIEIAEKKDNYQLSSAQKRLYTLQQLEVGTTSYNIPNIVEIEGTIEEERLQNAYKKLLTRHETLRTSFIIVNDEPVQMIHDKVEAWVEVIEVEEKDIQETIKALIKPFELNKAPLIRVILIKVAHGKNLLMYDIHHIISDGISMKILVEEFMKFYSGKELPQLTRQYKDYSEWQNKLIETKEFEKEKIYWLNMFKESIPVLNMPSDYVRPEVNKYDGRDIEVELNIDVVKRLKKLSENTGTTMYMILMAAFNVLLSKYSNQEDIVVGTPIAGRAHIDLEGIIGMFVNTLAMRNKPEGEKTFLEFLSEVKGTALQAYENQNYQFEELVDHLEITRDFSRNPIFDVMFAMQNFEKVEIEEKGLRVTPYNYENNISKFDLTMTAIERDERIMISINYCTSLFKEATIIRMMEHYENILSTVTEDENVQLKYIDMLSTDEKEIVVKAFNDTYVEYSRDKTIQDLFEVQSIKYRDRIAVNYDGKILTYSELNNKANYIAKSLVEKGVTHGDIIAINANKSLEMIIGILAVLKAGAAYLPLDFNYPSQRIQFMLDDCGVKLLLSNFDLDMEYEGIEILKFNSVECPQYEESNIITDRSSSDLAYIMYTSGSTGKPKGVMVEQMNIVRLVENISYVQLREGDHLLQTGSIAFDAATFEIWGSLLNGLTLFMVPQEKILSSDILEKIIYDNKINIMWLTVSLFNKIISENENVFNSLDTILVGGDKLTPNYINKLRSVNKNITIINGYGPTENTTFSTCFTIQKEYKHNIPIGKPISNSKAFVLDSILRLQPIGVVGELFVSGDGVARGYLNNEKLTRERFMQNPYVSGERMYKTGDLARWLPDGNIEFCGRADDQVKLRGYRIELGEIESQLLSDKRIKEAVVVSKGETDIDKYLCAYVTTIEEVSDNTIKENLSIALPDYMIPSAIVRLENMPITINGKIDKKALPTPHVEGSKNGVYEGPRNEREEKLIEIWEDILGVKKISINDNFFELGGHSLRATVLASKIHKEFSVDMPLSQIFKSPTIKALSAYIVTNAKGIYKSIDIAEEKDHYLLSSAQKRLYTLQQLEAGTTSYNIPNIVEIEGSIEEECLQKAYKKLLDRHETLRTSFEIVNDEPVQMIHDEIDACVEIIAIEEKDIQETIKSLIKPFELNKAPLIRVTLIKVSDGKSLLMYDIHHIISDGISMKILVEEFMKLYSENELPQLTRQYKDYSEWQNKLMESKELEKEKAYWMNVFKENIPVLNISSDYTRPAVKKYDGRDIEVELDIDVVKRLKKLSGDTGTTMYMILIAAFNVLLSKYSNQEDIVVGTPIAGRAHIDLEGIIGMFVNTLAMRNKPESEKTFLEFLNEVKYTALQAYENQNYQFEELVDHLEVVRDFSRNPIFDVMFAMQNFEKVEIEEKGLRVTPYNYENRVAKFDLTMTAMERDERIMVSINYCTSLFKKTTIIRMIEHYENILSRITEDENVQIKDIDMLSTNEREMVVETFNATHVEYNRNKTIQEIFEKQVEENHKKTALIYENREMTYEDLNKRSNQLARKLREYGVTKDSIVGLMVERSFEMIVGIMAILKAGGAYLPIDPEYPQNRIEYILDNSETRMLLTQSWIREKVKYEHKVIELDDQEIYKGDSSNPVNINDGRDLAYVIYTSGSTGKPKGVLIEHHNVVNFMIGITDEIPFDENEKVLSLTTISFDIFVLELIVPLLKSMTVVIANDDEQKNIVSINNLIKERSIDILQLTPSRFSILNAIYKDGKCFEGIKELIIGGEEFPDQLYDLVEKGLIDCNIYNVYGPTETTVWSTILKVESSKELTIGKPLANTKIFIVDHNNLVQGIGMEGEICIAGEGVTRGYIRNSKLTEEKFPENSLGNNVRVYRTGDLGKWLPDGNIMYCGRKDQQHKINGYRIELTEIEKILELKTEIEKVVVNVSNDKDQKVICAYIVFKDRRIEVDVKEIRQFLIRELPHYMIPTYYFSISEVPLTPNGKVDLKSLPSIENQEQRNKQYVPPVSDVEIGLTKIWRNIFDNRQIGITDDFFEIGGNSLKLMKVVYNIRQQFNAEIPLVEAFRLTTIEELAEYINKSHRIEYKKINYNYNREFYPLSSAQKRMYILNQINEENTGYNLTAVLRLDGLYHIEYLEDALIRLVERHEVLRTIFELLNGTVVQRIIDSSKVEPKIQRLEVIGSIENSINQFIQPFDLGNAPLMRVGIVNESEKRGYLIIDMHHIISDGTSLSIISDEFIKLYKKDTLPEVHVEYKDYTLWQEQYRKTEEYKKQGDYWYDTLKDYNRCLLDTDYKRPEIMKYSGESVDYYTDEEILGKLKKLALDSKTTLFMILLSAYDLLLYKYTGEKSIVVGTPISGRTRQEFESMVGLFVNTLALINHINVNETYLDFLLSVKNSTLQGYSNQDYQFDELVELLEIEPQKNSNPIFSTMFMLQNFVDEEVNEENGIEGLNITQVPYENPYVKLDIKFATQVVGNRLVLTVEYASELFKRETIDIFVQDYIKIIKKIIKNPRFLIKTIETKVDREIEDILSDFNDDLEGDY